MSTTDKTWVFASDNEGLADGGNSTYLAVAYNSTGNPAGSLGFTDTQRKTTTVSEWALKTTTTDTWQTWTVPLNGLVTGVQLISWDYNWSSTTYVSSATVTMEIVDSNGTVINTLISNSSLTIGTSWYSGSAGTLQSVPVSYQNYDTSVRLKITVSTTSTSGGTVNAILRLDNILVRMTYNIPTILTVNDAYCEDQVDTFAVQEDVPLSHAPRIGRWNWYSNATPDTSMVALGTENTKHTLTGAQMQNYIARLRVQIKEIGGQSGSGAVGVDFTCDGTNWFAVEAQSPTDEGVWFRWANGAGAVGGSVSNLLLTNSTSAGLYHEATALSESVAGDDFHEMDLALYIHWPAPDQDITFRITYGGTPLAYDTGVSTIQLRTCSSADRPYTVGQLPSRSDGTQPQELFFAANPHVFADGSGNYWTFLKDSGLTTTLMVFAWNGTGGWTKTTRTFANSTGNLRVNQWMKTINGTPVVMVFSNNATNMEYMRGTASGTTMTWDSATTMGSSSPGNYQSVGIDDGNYWWLACVTSGGLWARRSTNADAGSSWTAGWQAAKTTTVSSQATGKPICIVGLASDKALCIFQTGNALQACTVTDAGGFSSVTQLAATTNMYDWGVVRSGGYVYLVHTDSTTTGGNWILRVFNESNDTWSLGTSPNVSGLPGSSDCIPLVAVGNDIYALTTNGPGTSMDRVLTYKKYTGPGAAGTWDTSLTDFTVSDRTNMDEVNACTDGNRVLAIVDAGDFNLAYQTYTIEYHYFTLATTLTVSDAYCTSQVDAVTVTTQQTLAINDAYCESQVDVPNVTKQSSLVVTDASVETQVDAVSLTTSFATTLTIEDVYVTTQIDNVQITKQSTLAITDSFVDTQADSPTVEEVGAAKNLVVDDSSCSSFVDTLVTSLASRVRVTWIEFQIPESAIPTLIISDAYCATQVDNAGITKQSELVVNDSATTPETDVVSVSKQSALAVSNTFVGTQTDVLVTTKQTTLSLANLYCETQTDILELTKESGLGIADASCTPALDNVLLVQIHQLSVANCYTTTQVDQLSLSGQGTLGVANVFVSTQVDAVVTTKSDTLVIANAFVETQVDSVSPTKSDTLLISDSYVLSQVDVVAITKSDTLVVADNFVTTQIDNVGLSGAGYLSVNSVYCSTQVDTPTVTKQSTLVVANTNTTPQVDVVSTTKSDTLFVQDSFVTTQVDTVGMSQVITLNVSDAFCNDQVDTFKLAVIYDLVVGDSYLTTQSDSFVLSQLHQLRVEDAYVLSQTDIVSFTKSDTLEVADSYVTSQCDIALVTTTYSLGVADTFITSQVDSFNLTQTHNLIVEDIYTTSQVDSFLTSKSDTLFITDAYCISTVSHVYYNRPSDAVVRAVVGDGLVYGAVLTDSLVSRATHTEALVTLGTVRDTSTQEADISDDILTAVDIGDR